MKRDFNDSGGNAFTLGIVNVVKSNISRILNIRKGSGFFDEILGTRLHTLFFNLLDDNIHFKVIHILLSDLPSQEPRITIIPAKTKVSFDSNANILYITLAFFIKTDPEVIIEHEVPVRVK